MKFQSNAHTHTTYCDGQDDISSMVFQAQELKFVSLGFSEHAYQGFDLEYCMSFAGQQSYWTELRAAQEFHNGNNIAPKIHIGLEQDTLTPQAHKDENRKQFDYIIGSSHYLTDQTDGVNKPVDGTLEMLAC